LQRENAELREEKGIFKKALAIFSNKVKYRFIEKHPSHKFRPSIPTLQRKIPFPYFPLTYKLLSYILLDGAHVIQVQVLVANAERSAGQAESELFRRSGVFAAVHQGRKTMLDYNRRRLALNDHTGYTDDGQGLHAGLLGRLCSLA
jgi:hypothetical protein